MRCVGLLGCMIIRQKRKVVPGPRPMVSRSCSGDFGESCWLTVNGILSDELLNTPGAVFPNNLCMMPRDRRVRNNDIACWISSKSSDCLGNWVSVAGQWSGKKSKRAEC